MLERNKRHIHDGRARLEAIETKGNELLETLEERRDKMKEIAASVTKIQEQKSVLSEKQK
jgi:hypothetical protein